VLPADRHARTDQRESPDKIEPTLAAEPIEKAEATEPTEPTERIEPAEPIDKIEPAEPIDKIDPAEPMLRSEPAEPPGRGEPSVFCMRRSSQHVGQRQKRMVRRHARDRRQRCLQLSRSGSMPARFSSLLGLRPPSM